MPNAIETQSLCKDFGKFHAVIEAVITVKTGCICGFIGKNGAGKTTVMRMLTGLMKPSRGNILVLNGMANLLTGITAFLIYTIVLTVLFFAVFQNQDEMSYNE